MSRPIKPGLSYFSLDTDYTENPKLEYITAKFGAAGEGIFIRLLCRIYRAKGYAMDFNDDVARFIAKSLGNNDQYELVKEVVYELLNRGIFDEDLFKQFGLLTSAGIQKRYAKICTDCKRKDWNIPAEFDLRRSKPTLTPEETPLTTEVSTQSKVEESKVEKNKEEKNIYVGMEDKSSAKINTVDLIKNIKKPLDERRKDFHDSLLEFIPHYGKTMITEFFNYWAEPNAEKTAMKLELKNTWDLHYKLTSWKHSDSWQTDEQIRKKEKEFAMRYPTLNGR